MRQHGVLQKPVEPSSKGEELAQILRRAASVARRGEATRDHSGHTIARDTHHGVRSAIIT
jgi:hypothetical protein